MEWWGISATLFAAASLAAVIWQIARFEATLPALGWSLTVSMSGIVRDGRREVDVTFCPSGPIVLHEVESQEWGEARVRAVTERARMDCDSESLVARAIWAVGKEGFVGFTWLQPSLVRREPVRHAIRARLPDGQVQLWRWYRMPRPTTWRQGRWRDWHPTQPRKSHVPDMWGAPGSR